jgi:hypothetical protein
VRPGHRGAQPASGVRNRSLKERRSQSCCTGTAAITSCRNAWLTSLSSRAASCGAWDILIVDDEPDVHEALKRVTSAE